MSNIIPKSVIDKIISGEATLKEFEEYKNKINARFCYIIQTISKIKNYEINWFDYDNLALDDEINGFFDPSRYKDNIYFVVQYYNKRTFDYKNHNFNLYENSFPTSFLYSDFEDLVSSQYQKFKDDIDNSILKENQIKKEFNQNYNKMVEQIKTKLTKEELAYVTFVKPKK